MRAGVARYRIFSANAGGEIYDFSQRFPLARYQLLLLLVLLFLLFHFMGVYLSRYFPRSPPLWMFCASFLRSQFGRWPPKTVIIIKGALPRCCDYSFAVHMEVLRGYLLILEYQSSDAEEAFITLCTSRCGFPFVYASAAQQLLSSKFFLSHDNILLYYKSFFFSFITIIIIIIYLLISFKPPATDVHLHDGEMEDVNDDVLTDIISEHSGPPPLTRGTMPSPEDLYGRDVARQPRASGAASAASSSTSTTASSAQVLEGARADAALPRFELRAAELHQRIQEIEKTLRGAGKSIQERDQLIQLLQEEVHLLRRQQPSARERRHPVARHDHGTHRSHAHVEAFNDFHFDGRRGAGRGSSLEGKDNEEEGQAEQRGDSSLDTPPSRRKAHLAELLATLENTPAAAPAPRRRVRQSSRGASSPNGRVGALAVDREVQGLQEEVDMLRRSLQGLVSLLAQVPEMSDWLRDAGLPSTDSVYVGDLPPLAPWAGATLPDEGAATGVDNGLYGGTTSAADSKNIWLNGRWMDRLRELLAASISPPGGSTPRGLAEARRVLSRERRGGLAGSPAPERSSGDVLRSRNAQQDYWVPMRVFRASQAFKDRHCPAVGMSDFYPFLKEINGIWREQMKSKLRPLRQECAEAKQQLAAQSKELEALRQEVVRRQQPPLSPIPLGTKPTIVQQARGRSLAQRPAPIVSSRPAPPNDALSEARCALKALRQHIRLDVTSPAALQVAQQYETILSVFLVDAAGVQVSSPTRREFVAPADEDARSLASRTSTRSPYAGTRPPSQQLFAAEPSNHCGASSTHAEGVGTQTSENQVGDWGNSIEGDEEEAPHRYRGPDPRTERLLCVVQHTCERVEGAGQCVEERVTAATRDLTRFLSQLRQFLHVETGSDQSRGSTGSPAELSVAADDASRLSRRDTKDRQILLQVIESALDYSDEVLAEVSEAVRNVRAITSAALLEAERSKCVVLYCTVLLICFLSFLHFFFCFSVCSLYLRVTRDGRASLFYKSFVFKCPVSFVVHFCVSPPRSTMNLAFAPSMEEPRDTAETIQVSSLALLKMLLHGRAGVPLEVMGLMIGHMIDDYTIRVTDVFSMPQTATGQSVEAVNPEYQSNMLDKLKLVGRHEDVVGWYHSHPGFGCWLSAEDIQTAASYEQLTARSVSVVVDPIQSVPGNVVIDAFRNIPREMQARLMSADSTGGFTDPRQVTSNIGFMSKSSPVALSRGLNQYYYSMPITFRKKNHEINVLMNVYKKGWQEGFKLEDVYEHEANTRNSIRELISHAKQAEKFITQGRDEDDVGNIGRPNAVAHLHREANAVIERNLHQSIGAMINAVVF
eukprot:gene11954-8229_t